MTAVIHGHNPTNLYFDEGKMRPHLIGSLQKVVAIDVSCGKNPKEEKGDTQTHCYSSLLDLDSVIGMVECI